METTSANETRRLQALRAYAVLDTPAEPAFDDLAAAAAQIAGVPHGFVSLVDENRQWFKAHPGTGLTETSRDIAFCAHTVAANDVLVVPDARQDPRFVDNPLVTGPPYLRFYAGFPLRTPGGHVLGTLCVLGPHPAQLDIGQRRLLQVLADQVMNQLELRRQSAEQGRARRQATELAEQLAASEQRYRLLAEHATDIVSRHAPDGSVLYVSPSLRTVLGADPDLEIGDHAPDRVHPDDRGLLDEALRSVGAGEGPVTVTMRAGHADGSWRWLETTLSALLAADGSLLELHSSARDVTARIIADQARQESERRHRELVEQTPDGILVHVDGLITFANAAAARMLGATDPQDLLGLAVADFADPVNRERVLERMSTLISGGSVPTLRQRARRLDGTWVTVEASGSRVDFDGRAGIQYVLRDVTAQQEAAAAILLSEQQHRSLFELSPVGLVEADPDGRMLRVNNTLAALLGRSPQELEGLLIRDLTEPLRPGEDRVGARAAAGEDTPGAERVFVRPDGERVQCVLSSAVVRNADGTVERIVVTVVDMTERNAARAELETLVTELQEARAEADRRTALLDAVLETIDVGVVACDAAGRLILFNRATREFHGLPADPDIDPANWSDHYALRAEDGVTPLNADRVPLYRALVEGQVNDQHITITPTGLPLRTLRVDGRALLDAEGHVTGAVVAMKDVTELRASEQRFRAAFQNGPTPMARLDPDGTVRDANPALRRFLSIPTSRLLGRRLTELVHPDDATLLLDVLSGLGTGTSPVELRLLRQDGVAVWCELATTNATSVGGAPYVLAQLLDVHDRKNHELRLELAANQDPLTGLGNRQMLDRELAHCLAPTGGPGATVLFVDLDGFKAVNDQLGHDIGDLVLVQTANRLRAAVRPGDTVTRTGGDEFVVVCPGGQAAGALLLRVEQALSLPIVHDGALLAVGASVGSAVGARGDDPVALVALADQAMYRSKQARRA